MDPFPWLAARFPASSQRGPHPTQCLPRLTLQLVRADPQHRIAEPGQEGSALLLALALVALREQLHDQRTLRADVRDDERADLAARIEAVRMK